ncbi:GLPGLI family protein [Salegentibacter sp. LM13S]|uniref:GLPGLI family protein n=1 Tax=Salegentibacter lacus TaxID=2873599 RepID=UPI001CCA70CD|nr:GLPGLI family protein [Salegentibacter lacus]MBZ9632374.1 GLPGLI family protein [Salegentibacter lacus]
MNNYFSLLLILFSTICNAQKLTDKFEYKVTYKLTYKLDSTNLDESKSEYMILFAGDELSKFSSRAKTLTNPIVRKGNTAHTSREAVTDFQYIILKNRSENKLFFTRTIARDQFYYTQEMDQFEWEILPEIKKIKDFKVQKAKTSFGGRDYVAWFTFEIPISDGPYKFNGLPGLILELEDTQQHYVFEFYGLGKLRPKLKYKINLSQFAETNKTE